MEELLIMMKIINAELAEMVESSNKREKSMERLMGIFPEEVL